MHNNDNTQNSNGVMSSAKGCDIYKHFSFLETTVYTYQIFIKLVADGLEIPAQ